MNDSFTPLDLPSEGLLIWEQPGFPQTDYAAFVLLGHLDPGALNEALRGVLATRPTFTSRLVWRRIGWSMRPVWIPGPPAEPAFAQRDFRAERTPADLEEWVHDKMRPVTTRIQDLANEPPIAFELWRVDDERWVVVIVFHHVATDGGGLYDVLRELFAAYHERVTGARPAWADVAGIHAQAGTSPPVAPVSTPRMVLRALRMDQDYPGSQVAQPWGSSDRPHGRRMIRYVYEDPGVQSALRKRAARSGGSVTDLCVAASKLAMEEWNRAHGADADVFLHGIAVNQRARRPPEEIEGQGNPMSGFAIPSRAAERRNPEAVLRLVIARRKEGLAQGYDIALSEMGRKLQRVGLALPRALRYRALRTVFDRKISFFLTNLGVVWPVIRDGRPTGETAIREVGRAVLHDVHSSVGGTANNPAAMILRTFLGRFYMVFTLGGQRFRDDEARDFAATVVRRVFDWLD